MKVNLTAEEHHALYELLNFVLRRADPCDPDSTHLRRVRTKLHTPDAVLCNHCGRGHYARGLCRRHYMEEYRGKAKVS